jgi:hypothetical protein
MNFMRFALVAALASPWTLAQIAPARMEEAKQKSQAWKKWAGGRERPFAELTPKDQLEFLMGTARDHRFPPNRDAALVLLSQWPYEQGLAKVVANDPDALAALSRLGYRRPAVLAENLVPTRPWVHGIGLHLDGGGWRIQVIPSPAFLPKAPEGEGLPKVLASAPVPSVLVRLAQLRPGLQRLADTVGGSEDHLLKTAAAGSRAGFLLKHVQTWLAKAEPALGPLADRPAWILHYGLSRPEARRMEQGRVRPEGTLVFLPGPLPKRTELALSFLKLNPFSSGARARKAQLPDGTQVDQVHGSGGVLYLETTPEGTWLSDRPAALVARHQSAEPRLGQSEGWGRMALSGAGGTLASLWMIPRQALGQGFEQDLASLSRFNGTFPAASGPLLKAAPRGSAVTAVLGGGPTARALQAFFRVDLPYEVPVHADPTIGGQALNLSPEQKRDLAMTRSADQARAKAQAAMRKQLEQLSQMLDGQGAAFHWNGWTPAPPLSDAERTALVTFRKQGYWMNTRKERMNQAPGFGGYGEPGLTPSLAFALPLKAGRAKDAEALLGQLFPAAFQGQLQSRPVGGATLRRMRTVQAFAPSFVVQGELLVLASDDGAAQSVLAGLQGQAPTLADLPPLGWGQAEVDGPRLAAEVEKLLQAYLGVETGRPRRWWEATEAQSGDEVAEEVSSTFGPLLELVRKQGRLRFELNLGAAGLELRPR